VQTDHPAPWAQRSKRFGDWQSADESTLTPFSAREYRHLQRVNSRPSRARAFAKGIGMGTLAGAGLFALALAIPLLSQQLRILSAPSLLLSPFLVGFVAARYWSEVQFGIRDSLLHSLTCTLFAFTLAAIAFHEGIVCLLILAPIYYVAVLSGALTGRVWFRKRGRLNSFAIPVLALIVVGEPALRSPHTGVVTDQIRINAPPSKVWPHVLAFDTIPGAPNYWLFYVGLPYPTRTTNSGNFVGADRACQFSGGAVFKEKIAEFEPNHLFTFDIVEMPADPELIGHLDAHRGQFELRDNHDGTTTLVGRTWYSLHVRPAWYFDWWTHDIFRAVHRRVMNNVKQLADAQP
jgi:hypothetical protein